MKSLFLHTPFPSPAITTTVIITITLFHPTTAKYTPFGYQSDSSLSSDFATAPQPPSDSSSPPFDPSSFAGAIHYDPLNHALYITGATFASGVFDGGDFFQVQKEKEALNSSGGGDDVDAYKIVGKEGEFWWNDMSTGLQPHLEDLGVPEYSPIWTGDCFYAVLGLPVEGDGLSGPSGDGSGGGNVGGTGGGLESKTVKLVHSRRFGSANDEQACSAIDVLFASPKTNAPGGYVHDFETLLDEHTLPPAMVSGGTAPANDDQGDADGVGNDITRSENSSLSPAQSAAPTPTSDFPTFSPTTPPTYTQNPSTSTRAPTATFMPSSSTYFPTFAPTATAAPSSLTRLPTDAPTHLVPTFGPSADMMANRTYQGDGGDRLLQSDTVLDKIDVEAEAAIEKYKEVLQTRSVRLLMAGHIISSETFKEERDGGYILSDLPAGQFNQAAVYGFAQQVDVRLPLGPLSSDSENGDGNNQTNESDSSSNGDPHDLDDHSYELYNHAGEDSFDVKPWHEDPDAVDALEDPQKMQELYGNIVTSGVESRALLNDGLAASLNAVYPVSIVADPSTKRHYYVLLLASEKPTDSARSSSSSSSKQNHLHTDPTTGSGATQTSRTDYADSIADARMNGDFFGANGRPEHGSDFRIVLRKVEIADVGDDCTGDDCALTAAESALAGTSHERGKIAMRHQWSEQYAPDFGEDARPSSILYVPSGEGTGSAFGTNMDQAALLSQDGSAPKRFDLDGFLMKINPATGAFVGRDKFDSTTSTFTNTHSYRVESFPNQDDIVTGMCSTPLRQVGTQTKMRYIYVVGSTSGELPALVDGVRDKDFLSKLADQEGSDGMEAFLFKIDLDTMDPVWTVQLGAFFPRMNIKGDAYGYGCAVSPLGDEVFFTGIVKGSSVVTDFSSSDAGGNEANGGTDIFVASYTAEDGTRNFLRQVGSKRDDFPSKGNGGIATDRLGNAILTGDTRGSIMRKRDVSEYKYGHSSNIAASDVFIMSFESKTGLHADILDDGVPALVHNIAPAPAPSVDLSPFPAPFPAPLPSPAISSEGGSPENNGATIFGTVVISLFLATTFIAMIGMAFRARKKSLQRKRENAKDINLVGRRKNPWNHPVIDTFEDMDIMVEVRASASGGWHGVYEIPDDGTSIIDFGVTTPPNVPDQSLFAMEDGLEEIENSHHNISIDDFDEVSEQDLIDAYNEAIEEDYDFEPDSGGDDIAKFSMPSMGSTTRVDDDDDEPQMMII